MLLLDVCLLFPQLLGTEYSSCLCRAGAPDTENPCDRQVSCIQVVKVHCDRHLLYCKSVMADFFKELPHEFDLWTSTLSNFLQRIATRV